MKKFNEWMEDRKDVVNEDTPHSASVHYGRFLGQIMGWDSHGDPKTISGRITNYMAGGRHRKAQQMGGDLYATIANPSSITAIIARAQKDGVFQTSTFNACYEMVKTIAQKYNPSAGSLNSPQFQSDLLHKILGKCHKSMGLEYTDAEDMYHDIIGTNPAAKKALSIAYDKDPKDLTEWLTQAAGAYKPHPAYDATVHHGAYWLLEAQGIISPLNLVKMLVNKSPDKALSMPQNTREIQSYSIEFAEAYFPNIINKRKAGAAAASGGGGGGGGGAPDLSKLTPQQRYGADIDSLIDILNHFETNSGVPAGADGSFSSKKKADLVTALGKIIGPTAAAAAGTGADSGSLMARLSDHTTFFGLGQLMESRKLD